MWLVIKGIYTFICIVGLMLIDAKVYVSIGLLCGGLITGFMRENERFIVMGW